MIRRQGPPAAVSADNHAPQVPPAIEVAGLTRVFRVQGRRNADVTALNGVDLALPVGSFTALVGASGCGKSTLLQCIAGLDVPTAGTVQLLGTRTNSLRPRPAARFRARHVGFVFQEYNLIASLTAAENVSMPSRLAGRPLGKRRTVAALEAVGLADRAGLKPHQLSGGERQRVAIARGMASQPRIVFADEPTGSLDTHNRSELQALFFRLRRELDQTFVIVTHDEKFAAQTDRCIRLADGRVVD